MFVFRCISTFFFFFVVACRLSSNARGSGGLGRGLYLVFTAACCHSDPLISLAPRFDSPSDGQEETVSYETMTCEQNGCTPKHHQCLKCSKSFPSHSKVCGGAGELTGEMREKDGVGGRNEKSETATA